MRVALKMLLVVVGAMMFQTAFADAQAEADYRQSVMKSVGGHMSAMGNILKNQVHTGDLALHARGLAVLSDVAPNVFVAGSGTEKSKALPEIWEDPEDFAEKMDDFRKAAKAMVPAAESGDMSQIGPAIQALGGSCKGCHDDFKAE